jgi:hypothetical protein
MTPADSREISPLLSPVATGHSKNIVAFLGLDMAGTVVADQLAPPTNGTVGVSPLNPSTGCWEVFVPGRLCLFGEHSDWAGQYRR